MNILSYTFTIYEWVNCDSKDGSFFYTYESREHEPDIKSFLIDTIGEKAVKALEEKFPTNLEDMFRPMFDTYTNPMSGVLRVIERGKKLKTYAQNVKKSSRDYERFLEVLKYHPEYELIMKCINED